MRVKAVMPCTKLRQGENAFITVNGGMVLQILISGGAAGSAARYYMALARLQ